jgi:hypothetical protein
VGARQDGAGTVGSMSADDACVEVIRRERQLLDPEVRRQPDRVRALIHPLFVEFGASGRVWDADSVVQALASAHAPSQVAATDLVAVRLAPDVVLLTFRTETAEQTCLRSSVWVRGADGQWLNRFHQASAIAARPR